MVIHDSNLHTVLIGLHKIKSWRELHDEPGGYSTERICKACEESVTKVRHLQGHYICMAMHGAEMPTATDALDKHNDTSSGKGRPKLLVGAHIYCRRPLNSSKGFANAPPGEKPRIEPFSLEYRSQSILTVLHSNPCKSPAGPSLHFLCTLW